MYPFHNDYYRDYFLSWCIRVTLWFSAAIILAVLTVGCSSTAQNGRDELSFSGNFQGAKTRNYLPPTTGGDNEKSDSSPIKPAG
ncbi:hypothetical protein QIP82_gp3 [ssRNA phage Gephyllon.1_24]|uniref:Uncharacterized protein n=2 Tax=Leviviricetes TaxID=2842243 RepID=A0A8S5KYF6_9VIRU|nr:hypothetical protein QIP82_gp3 [ssRNA phage Gephyllon.1_24]QDH90077.1 MAG: hypothetical protein H1BulkLitter6246_000003 [Leviviridae sp.]DAD50449.1 TPA_asm: hypothetical protein [ssRNA phage Gephyllon.1_24]